MFEAKIFCVALDCRWEHTKWNIQHPPSKIIYGQKPPPPPGGGEEILGIFLPATSVYLHSEKELLKPAFFQHEANQIFQLYNSCSFHPGTLLVVQTDNCEICPPNRSRHSPTFSISIIIENSTCTHFIDSFLRLFVYYHLPNFCNITRKLGF